MTKNTTQLEGSTLVPDFDAHPGIAVATEHAYWMGLRIDCPAHQINIAGLNFPKNNETFVDDPNRTGKRIRIPVLGGLNKGVRTQHIEALREALPRLVIRFKKAAADEVEEPGTGVNIGDVHTRVRKGFVITIPTKVQVAEAEKAGTRIPRYVRQPGDEPAARYMYFQLCDSQDAPQRGLETPASIEATGIFWPDEISEADELLG